MFLVVDLMFAPSQYDGSRAPPPELKGSWEDHLQLDQYSHVSTLQSTLVRLGCFLLLFLFDSFIVLQLICNKHNALKVYNSAS